MKKVINIILLVVLGVSLSGCEWFEHNGGMTKNNNCAEVNEHIEKHYGLFDTLTAVMRNGADGFIVASSEVVDSTIVDDNREDTRIKFRINPIEECCNPSGSIFYRCKVDCGDVSWGNCYFKIEPGSEKTFVFHAEENGDKFKFKGSDKVLLFDTYTDDAGLHLWIANLERRYFPKLDIIKIHKDLNDSVIKSWLEDSTKKIGIVPANITGIESKEYPRFFYLIDGVLYNCNNYRAERIYNREELSLRIGEILEIYDILIPKNEINFETNVNKKCNYLDKYLIYEGGDEINLSDIKSSYRICKKNPPYVREPWENLD